MPVQGCLSVGERVREVRRVLGEVPPEIVGHLWVRLPGSQACFWGLEGCVGGALGLARTPALLPDWAAYFWAWRVGPDVGQEPSFAA